MAVYKKIYADTGAINVLDSRTTVPISLGAATASKVDVSRAGVVTEIKGPLTASAGATIVGAVVFDKPTFDLTLSVTDQTVGAATVTVPNLAGLSGAMVITAATQTLTNKTITDTTNTVRASELGTTAASVVVSGAPQPSVGHILTATSPIAAAWAAPVLSGPGISINKGIVTFNGLAGTVFQGAGVRHYGTDVLDPVAPAPGLGDTYYNSILNHLMMYDAGRASWLSAATFTIGFGRNGNVTAGTFYRGIDGLQVSATNSYLCQKGTVVYIGFTTSVAAAHTFEVLIGGVVFAFLGSGGAVSASTTSINAPFAAGVVSARNSGASATSTNMQALITFKLRA